MSFDSTPSFKMHPLHLFGYVSHAVRSRVHFKHNVFVFFFDWNDICPQIDAVPNNAITCFMAAFSIVRAFYCCWAPDSDSSTTFYSKGQISADCAMRVWMTDAAQIPMFEANLSRKLSRLCGNGRLQFDDLKYRRPDAKETRDNDTPTI